MKRVSKLLSILLGRVARNVYLWLVMLYLVLNNDPAGYTYSPRVYYCCIAITTAIIMGLTYVNNLYLLPRYLAKRQYLKYFLLAFLNVTVFGLIYILAIKSIWLYYPKLLMHHITVLSTIVAPVWTIRQIAYEVWFLYMGFGIWTLVLTMTWYVNDYNRQQKLLIQSQQKQLETELHFLKSQINPHFLFNTLNNMYGLAMKKADETPGAIIKLSSILRYILYEANHKHVSFEREKEVMNAYINLELLRLPPGNNLSFMIENDREYFIPPLLWLPVLENTFKHSTRVIADSYYIDFRVIIKDRNMLIRSCNNYRTGVITDEKIPGGIGLENLRKRLDILYPGRYEMHHGAEGEHYVFELSIKI